MLVLSLGIFVCFFFGGACLALILGWGEGGSLSGFGLAVTSVFGSLNEWKREWPAVVFLHLAGVPSGYIKLFLSCLLVWFVECLGKGGLKRERGCWSFWPAGSCFLRVFGPGAAGSKEIGKRWMGNWERVICFFGCFPSCYCLVFSPFPLASSLSLVSDSSVSRSRGLGPGSPLGFSVWDGGGGFVWVLSVLGLGRTGSVVGSILINV